MALCMAQVEPQNEQLPLGYSAVLSAFEKVLVLRMLRPDKVCWPAGAGIWMRHLNCKCGGRATLACWRGG